MQDKEGSKAMSIYIVICFLLAGRPVLVSS